MSEPEPSEPPTGEPQTGAARWVKASVVGEETEGHAIDGQTGELPPPPQQPAGPANPPVTDEEISGARWFAVAFLVIVIPLGLALLAVMVWALLRSLDFLG